MTSEHGATTIKQWMEDLVELARSGEEFSTGAGANPGRKYAYSGVPSVRGPTFDPRISRGERVGGAVRPDLSIRRLGRRGPRRRRRTGSRQVKRLFLLRHAKSDWGNPGLDDFDRPLSKRGRNAAPRVAAWMRESDFVPELVLCSSARRTMETWERMAPVLGEIPTEHHSALYLGVARTHIGSHLRAGRQNPEHHDHRAQPGDRGARVSSCGRWRRRGEGADANEVSDCGPWPSSPSTWTRGSTCLVPAGASSSL